MYKISFLWFFHFANFGLTVRATFVVILCTSHCAHLTGNIGPQPLLAHVARPRPEDDLVQEALQLLALDLEAAHRVAEVPDPLLVPEPLLAQPLVGPLELHHAHLQLLVHPQPAVVHVTEGRRLLGQVLK